MNIPKPNSNTKIQTTNNFAKIPVEDKQNGYKKTGIKRDILRNIEKGIEIEMQGGKVIDKSNRHFDSKRINCQILDNAPQAEASRRVC